MKLSVALVLFNVLSSVVAVQVARDLGRDSRTKPSNDGGHADFNLPNEQEGGLSMQSNKKKLIIKFINKESMEEVKNSDLGDSTHLYNRIEGQNTLAMEVTEEELNGLKESGKVMHEEEDFELYALELLRSRDLAEEEPYGIEMVLEDVDWWKTKFQDSPPTGSSKLCVVDTGYGNGHEDLPTLDQNNDGFNPQSNGEWYIDGQGHGTHCAGSIGAVGGNSKGVIGVIPGSLGDKFSFFIGKGLSDSGSGSTSGVMAAVQACVDNGSNVISMSLGGGGFSETVDEQYHGHYENDDVLIIAAAGNGGSSALSYPASYKSVMSVAAVDSSENKASFSQYNQQTEISGPGVNVKSTVTLNNGNGFDYASYSGTSMATPHVAAVAGLLRMYFPDCKAFQIRNAMIVTAKDKGDSGCDVKYGHGIVQAKAAFQYLESNECDPNAEFKEPEGGCAEFSCSEDSDCDDGNPNTINTCNSGACESKCASNAACDDGEDCTVDSCQDGVCSNLFDCANCGGGASSVLKLTTDNYPAETEWDIKDSSGNEDYSGSEYGDSNTEYIINMCLEADDYTFKITDAYGDGICCSYGSGGYKILVENAEVVSGGEFGDSETETFTVGSSPPPPTSPPPVLSPTFHPSLSPSVPPVLSPITQPAPAPTNPPTVATSSGGTTVPAGPPSACTDCSNIRTPAMITLGILCETHENLSSKCNNHEIWRQFNVCQLSCYEADVGYEGDVCCDSIM